MLHRLGCPLNLHVHPAAHPFNQLWKDHHCTTAAFTSCKTCRSNKTTAKVALFFYCASICNCFRNKNNIVETICEFLSLMTQPPFLHNRVQNKHVKIFRRCRVLSLCTVQRVLVTYWDSRGLDWIRVGRCAAPVTLQSEWTELDRTHFCWWVRALRMGNTHRCRFCW